MYGALVLVFVLVLAPRALLLEHWLEALVLHLVERRDEHLLLDVRDLELARDHGRDEARPVVELVELGRELLGEVQLALLVVAQPELVKRREDRGDALVAVDAPLLVKEGQVRHRDRRAQLELLVQLPFGLRLLQRRRREVSEREGHLRVRVVLAHVVEQLLDLGALGVLVLVGRRHAGEHRLEHFVLVLLRPCAHGQLRDVEHTLVGRVLGHRAVRDEGPTIVGHDDSIEAAVPRAH